MSKNNLGMESNRVLNNLRHKLVCNANVKFGQNLFWSLGWIYQVRAGNYFDLAEQRRKNYDPISLFDTKLEWRTKNYQIFVEASNLFDKQYFDFANLIQAGRWVKAGVNIVVSR
jgi:iron complex outermembrane receptor protein